MSETVKLYACRRTTPESTEDILGIRDAIGRVVPDFEPGKKPLVGVIVGKDVSQISLGAARRIISFLPVMNLGDLVAPVDRCRVVKVKSGDHELRLRLSDRGSSLSFEKAAFAQRVFDEVGGSAEPLRRPRPSEITIGYFANKAAADYGAEIAYYVAPEEVNIERQLRVYPPEAGPNHPLDRRLLERFE